MIETIIFLSISTLNACFLCFDGYKFLQILQLSGYKLRGYIEWAKDTKAKYLSRLLFLSLLSFSGALVFSCAFFNINKYLGLCGLFFYIILNVVFLRNLFSTKKKTPLKTTYRMNRLIGMLFVLCFFSSFGLLKLSTLLPAQFYGVLIALSPIFIIILVMISHLILYPYEELNKIRYINQAKHKLKKYPYLIKIAITGSYGKTSTKYILNHLLSKKFNVCMSPHSFNTPMGLCKVVSKYLEPYHEVLITEMGANSCGDIAYLCSIINPTYGIMTGIGNQHLRTFYTMTNIKNTKYELVKSVCTQNGYMIFNGENSTTKEFYDMCKCEKQIVSTSEKIGVYASDIKLTQKETSFILHYGDDEVLCKTSLLGKHNIEDILLASALALRLGLSLESIKESISELKPIAHRLEVKEKGNCTIIDDSFNSSVQGYKSALQVLNLFSCKKIIITPGLVELGREEKVCNQDFGRAISEVCDVCIIVNKANAQEILEGIKSNEDSDIEVVEALNLDDAKLKLNNYLKERAVVLFENDLPDNYT